MLKKLLYSFIAMMASATLLVACGGDDEKKDEPVKPDVELKILAISPAGDIPGEGGTLIVEVAAASVPQVATNAQWIAMTGREQLTDCFKFVFSVEKNSANSIRTAIISFSIGTQTVTKTITQAAYVAPDPGTGAEVKLPEIPTGVAMPLLGLGWNLGNQFDSYNNGVASETCWGNPATTQALFDKLAADGLTTVRIPVTWLGKVGGAPDYKIDEKYLNRVKEVVGFAEKAGLKVIVNIHHDGAESKHWLDIKSAATSATTNNKIKEQLAAMWTQIANAFADKGDFLIFEPFNEIHDGGWGWGSNRTDGGKQYTCVNEWNQVFVDAVRATGGNNATRWLACVGYCTNPDLTIENLAIPIDPANHMMVAVHFYDPTEFTLTAKYDEWGHTGKLGKKETWGNEDNVCRIFAALKEKYLDKGYPVYIGEAGCVHRAGSRGESFRKYYLEFVAKAARTYGLALIIWDNGAKGAGNECHGYYNHATGEYINNAKDMIKALHDGFFNTSADYTLQSVFDNAPI